MKKINFILLFLGFLFNSYSQTNLTAEKCQDVFKEGNVLKYKNSQYSGTVIKIKNGFHIEKMKSDKVKLKSTITWISDCTVKLQLVQVNGKGRTNFKVGQGLLIEFYKVFENHFSYKIKLPSGGYGISGVLIVQN